MTTRQNLHPSILYQLRISFSFSNLHFKELYWKEAGHNTETETNKQQGQQFHWEENWILLFFSKHRFLSCKVWCQQEGFGEKEKNKFWTLFLEKKVSPLLLHLQLDVMRVVYGEHKFWILSKRWLSESLFVVVVVVVVRHTF